MNIPQPSSLGDLFHWESIVTIATNVAGNNAANAASSRIQVDSDRFFILESFMGSTNYDQSGGEAIAVVGASPGAAARALLTAPFAPNNFTVDLRYADDTKITAAPVPQACIAGSGYRAGLQLPVPVLFSPMTTFNLDFVNVAPVLLTQADNTTVIPLTISFALVGYFIPTDQLSNFLATYPPYNLIASMGQAGWLAKFTSQELPAGV